METTVDIVIVGGGIAGLATSLGLHRLGLQSLVLESSESLRVTGFALTLWTNAWRALDALGIADSLRQHSLPITENLECRCLRRKLLLETLEKKLPQGTVRYSSKVVLIEESGPYKLVHLADGSLVRTKVLIGCDGVNSVVAKWLGLQKPVDSKRADIRGFVEYPDKHGFEPKFYLLGGARVHFGFLPCDDSAVYWFYNFAPSIAHFDQSAQKDPVKLKEFVLSKIKNASKEVKGVVERTPLDSISCVGLKLRLPWNVLLGDIVRNNICVAGDALHPMTPDIGQGGCSALEDSVILARNLGEALLLKSGDEELRRIRYGLDRYAKERRCRSFLLITCAYLIGSIQASDNRVVSFLRDNFLARYTLVIVLRMADFDCGKLLSSRSR
nr:FAD-dependent urate hydroxylase-like isoform X1 [Ipomoea batatas]